MILGTVEQKETQRKTHTCNLTTICAIIAILSAINLIKWSFIVLIAFNKELHVIDSFLGKTRQRSKTFRQEMMLAWCAKHIPDVALYK